MTRRAASHYRAVSLESAAPPRLVLEAFRRLDEDLRRLRRCLEARDVAGKARAADHALALLGELEGALDHAAAPPLARELATVYGFCRRQVVLASLQLEPAPLDEAERVLAPVREAFEAAFAPGPVRP